MNKEEKKAIVEVFYYDDFTDTLDYCKNNNYITEEQYKYYIENCRVYPYKDEENYFEYNSDIITNLFDELGIDAQIFLELLYEIEREDKE